MISFFPDLNVWLALLVAGHVHNSEVWNWLNLLPQNVRLIFSRYTQLGLLRLLTNQFVMGKQILTLQEAWDMYDQWLEDPRVEFYAEPRGLESEFRKATALVSTMPASKWAGDCYLLAYARASQATLATFDKKLYRLAGKEGYAAIIPG